MSRVVPARLPAELLRGVNALVKSGRYANRSEVIKEATRLLLSSGGLPPPSSMARVAAHLVSVLVSWNSLGVESVTLYGSVARGEAGGESDVDILVVVEKGEPWRIRRSVYELIYPAMAGFGGVIFLFGVRCVGLGLMFGDGGAVFPSVFGRGRAFFGGG